MSSIVQSLVRISKISLSDYLALKDNFGESRQELKFLVPRADMPEIIDYLASNYMLCVNDNGEMSHAYSSTYFDTKDLKFFNMHRQGKYNRLKVRVREYKNGANSKFIECKRKVKGSKTLKDRIQLDIDSMDWNNQRIHSRLAKYSLSPNHLEKKLNVSYNRLILIEKSRQSRISIDFGIEAKDTNGKKVGLLPHHCILEIKSSETPKDVVKFLRSMGIREESFSKYCVSTCMLRDDVKSNKWKQVLKLC